MGTVAQVIFWPAYWIKEKVKVFFITYVKLLQMINSRSRVAQQRRKLRQSKRKKRSWKVALRRYNW